MRKRTSSITAKMTSAAVASGGVPVDGALAVWGASHAKEQLFQEKKLHKRKVEAYIAGALVQSEIDDEVEADADAAAKTDAKNATKRHRAYAKKETSRSGGTLPKADTLCNQPVFVDNDFDAATATSIEAKILKLKMVKVSKRTKTFFYVAPDPGNPGLRTAVPWQSWGNHPAANIGCSHARR